MNQTSEALDTIEIIKLFVSASLSTDILAIEYLLAEEGVFQIEDVNLELVDTAKIDFLQWYGSKLQETKINEVIYDQCIGCSFGKNILLFNNGKFPREPQDFADTTKAGLMINTFEGKITQIMFCFSFLKTENRAVFECVGDELVKYIKAGFSEEEAVAMYDANPESEYSYITKKINKEKEEGLSF
jgi:hypothetical protein